MENVLLYVLDIDFVRKHHAVFFDYVDESRKERSQRFVHEDDRLRCLGAGYLLKKYLPAGEILETPTGKPYFVKGPYFNLSHSGNYIILGVHPNREIGVDIEKIDPNKLDGIRFILNEEEKQIEDTVTLFQIWSNKESLLKCISTGIKDIKITKGLPLNGVRSVSEQDYYSSSLLIDNHTLSITLKGNEPFEIIIKKVTALED